MIHHRQRAFLDEVGVSFPGAVHFLEMEKEEPLLHLPCSHHVDERFFDAAITAKFGTKTQSPFQTQCQHFKKWIADNKESIPATIKYDPENPLFPYDDPLLARCRDTLVVLKNRMTKEGEVQLPRGDYSHLWEQVQVMNIMVDNDLTYMRNF